MSGFELPSVSVLYPYLIGLVRVLLILLAAYVGSRAVNRLIRRLRVRIKTKPITQWDVGREMNRRIKKKSDQAGIDIPFPHMSLYVGEASSPFRVQFEGREELREAVREVLEERDR